LHEVPPIWYNAREYRLSGHVRYAVIQMCGPCGGPYARIRPGCRMEPGIGEAGGDVHGTR
jgi:hypothetical protein